MNIEVEQGSALVNYVDVIIDTDECKVIEIGTHDRNPDLGGYASGSYTTIYPGNWDELNFAGTLEPTYVRFGMDGENWVQVEEANKHYVIVVMYKWDAKRTSAYVREV